MLKTKTGATFQEMIDQKRLIEAQRLLRESSMTIDTIAENLGYKEYALLIQALSKQNADDSYSNTVTFQKKLINHK